MGYTKDTLKGVAWTIALRGGTRLIGYFKILILARVLIPEQFGVFGIASITLAFFEIITETGINAFLIQEESDITKYINSAWLMSIIRGVIISLILLVTATFIGHFFQSEESVNIIRLTALIPLLRGFINPSVIKFQKHLQFDKEFLLRGFMYLVDALVAITVSIISKDASGIVWGMIAATLSEVMISWLFIDPKPRFKWESDKLKVILDSGKWITLSGIFNFFVSEGDDMVVGRLMSVQSLGFYQMSYKIATLPVKEVGGALGSVTFPVFTKIREDKFRLRRAFIKVVIASSILLIPFLIIMQTFTEKIVILLLGENWLVVVPAMKILTIFGVIRSYTGLSISLFLAIKKQQYNTMIIFFGILGIAITIIPLIEKLGITGAAYSALIGALFEIPLVIYFLKKELS